MGKKDRCGIHQPRKGEMGGNQDSCLLRNKETDTLLAMHKCHKRCMVLLRSLWKNSKLVQVKIYIFK